MPGGGPNFGTGAFYRSGGFRCPETGDVIACQGQRDWLVWIGYFFCQGAQLGIGRLVKSFGIPAILFGIDARVGICQRRHIAVVFQAGACAVAEIVAPSRMAVRFSGLASAGLSVEADGGAGASIEASVCESEQPTHEKARIAVAAVMFRSDSRPDWPSSQIMGRMLTSPIGGATHM